jgi:MerR family transcriptional regulator, copper efflux regulator
MAGLLIGAVAKETGLSVPTIRYYESLGLLSPAPRSSAGYRHYGNGAVEELRFIKKAQALGFSLEEIKEILTLSRSGTAACAHVLDLARHHLCAVDERIAQLSRFRNQLAGEIAKWESVEQPTCKGLCRIITDADDPGVEPIRIAVRPRSADT